MHALHQRHFDVGCFGGAADDGGSAAGAFIFQAFEEVDQVGEQVLRPTLIRRRNQRPTL